MAGCREDSGAEVSNCGLLRRMYCDSERADGVMLEGNVREFWDASEVDS